jgi:hypothetical protein
MYKIRFRCVANWGPRQLDLTFNATLSQSFGNIKFWGVVQTPLAAHRRAQSIPDDLAPGVTLLVFDFAKHGSLLSHLQKSMTGSHLDWGPIFWIVAAAAAGLSNLHKADIVHRYGILFVGEFFIADCTVSIEICILRIF